MDCLLCPIYENVLPKTIFILRHGDSFTIIRLESVCINILSIALRDITNQVIQPAAPPGNSDKESEPVSQEEGGSVSQQENEAVSQQVNEVDGDTIQTKVCQALEKVKQLSEEASRHITREKVMYKLYNMYIMQRYINMYNI